ncbi:MAG: efflux RND transporter periplasmic adaptor subunit [Candidatus Omnitrophica bacterium]|nr:efflux RND transporter periplasmic adaptor subunit [Candidatus Omnitrophota bacterium]
MNKARNKIIALLLVVAVAAFIVARVKKGNTATEAIKEIQPKVGAIQTFISTTGTVLPKNRLEVKPPVNGRIDKVLVQEGDMVKAGQIIAWMSSTERAALLDAARGQDAAAVQYWQDVYKAIPLLSPMDGQVIVATTQPAQTVTTADAVVVLSDHLIIQAQVDETDIGKISLGQKAAVSLDAYADKKIKAKVDHIYYESQTVNNVTIYHVDLLMDEVPAFLRSGMNANVDFVEYDKQNILLLPVDAVRKTPKGNFVFVKSSGEEPVKTEVELGITDDKNVEIVSGIAAEDTVIIKAKKYTVPAKDPGGKNPFMPARRPGR